MRKKARSVVFLSAWIFFICSCMMTLTGSVWFILPWIMSGLSVLVAMGLENHYRQAEEKEYFKMSRERHEQARKIMEDQIFGKY